MQQALDGALKQVKAFAPETPAMFFSVDAAAKKIFCLCAVPKVISSDVLCFVLSDLSHWC